MMVHRKRDRTRWPAVLLLWVAGILAAMQFAKFSVAFGDIQETYQAKATTIGFALSLVGSIGLIFGVVAGVFAGYLGYKKVLVGALFLGGALSILQGLLPPIELLLFSRVAEGASHLGIVVAAPTLMILLCADRHKSIAMGLWGTFFGVAFALMGWMGPAIQLSYGLVGYFSIHGVVMMVLGVACHFFLSVGDADVRNRTRGSSTLNTQFWKQVASTFTTPQTLSPGVAFLFHTAMYVPLLTFLPQLAPTEPSRKWLLVALPLVSIPGTFLAGIVGQYLLRPPTVLTLAYITVAVVAALTFVSAQHAVSYIIFTSILLFASGAVQGASFATIPFVAKTAREQASANGALAQLGNLGATMGPPAMAFLVSHQGPVGVVVFVIALCACGILSGLWTRSLSKVVNQS